MGWNYVAEPCGRRRQGGETGASATAAAAAAAAVACPAPIRLPHWDCSGGAGAGSLAGAVTSDVVTAVLRSGWVVLDGVLGPPTALKLRAEIDSLRSTGALRPNQTAFGAPAVRYTKPHVYEYDLHAMESEPEVAARLPEFGRLFEHVATVLVDRLNALLPGTVRLHRGRRGVAVKLQYNDGGGGCFPLHYDNPAPPNKRVLTCLVYLNPDWVEGDGGELQVVPFCGDAIEISPLLDRVVLFRSDRILHRVLPAARPRYCFTVWLDGDCADDVGDGYALGALLTEFRRSG
eukprot:CAMPEP_0182922324 /NCGR_PEP_ID=MMETSP0105_2-20130417/4725_1 /TAXON_ID=81532 ORGANISM="Acanthoeca-like sp., Strain 10tr" /NCGR_SAMPLE_ID=MMETSP0105_2 /ASSEMBLY_ACC=CAM_ASM_000205 /LENGTH=289 /DNA_ID=CAMNT_0025059931 /DNA_START=162 /DNA_END=1027 /DNA_ORIENTATION=+